MLVRAQAIVLPNAMLIMEVIAGVGKDSYGRSRVERRACCVAETLQSSIAITVEDEV